MHMMGQDQLSVLHGIGKDRVENSVTHHNSLFCL